jgi:putative cell wall-binding protein
LLLKLKVENEYLRSEVSSLKDLLGKEKLIVQDLRSREKTTALRNEEEFRRLYDDITAKHKEDIRFIEETKNFNVNNLMQDLKDLREKSEKKIEREKEILKVIHQSQLENQELIFKTSLELSKKTFEEQTNLYKDLIRTTPVYSTMHCTFTNWN